MQIRVSFIVDVPDKPGLDHASIQSWLEFNLGAACELRPSPISDIDLEAREHSVSFDRYD